MSHAAVHALVVQLGALVSEMQVLEWLNLEENRGIGPIYLLSSDRTCRSCEALTWRCCLWPLSRDHPDRSDSARARTRSRDLSHESSCQRSCIRVPGRRSEAHLGGPRLNNTCRWRDTIKKLLYRKGKFHRHIKGGVAWRDYVSFLWPDSGPIGYNTTTDDANAVFTCNIRETEAWVRLRFVSRTLARADRFYQVHSFTCSCLNEIVVGVNQYVWCYIHFNKITYYFWLMQKRKGRYVHYNVVLEKGNSIVTGGLTVLVKVL